MARILKIEGYIVDPDNSIYDNDIETILRNNDMITKHFKISEQNIGEWNDNLIINRIDCPKVELERYFKK